LGRLCQGRYGMVSIPLVIGTEYLHLLLPHSHAHAYRLFNYQLMINYRDTPTSQA
jgi:hypothetical protein